MVRAGGRDFDGRALRCPRCTRLIDAYRDAQAELDRLRIEIVPLAGYMGVASLLAAPGEVDQITRAERDAAIRERDGALQAVDRRSARLAGLETFRLRLSEGNDLARELR